MMSEYNIKKELTPEELDKVNKIFDQLAESAKNLPSIPGDNEMLNNVNNMLYAMRGIITELAKWKGDPSYTVRHGYLRSKVNELCNAFNVYTWDYNLTVPKQRRVEQLVCGQYQKGDIDAPEEPQILNNFKQQIDYCLVFDLATNKLKTDQTCESK